MRLFAAAAAVICLVVQPVAAATATVSGKWRTEMLGGATIRLDKCGNNLCGRIMAIDGESKANPRLDENNPNPARRQDRLVGKMFITNMKGGPDRWTDGKIYHPPSGKTVSGTLKMLDPKTLELEACVMMMCRKSKLTRIG